MSAVKTSLSRSVKNMLRPMARPVLERIRVDGQLVDQLTAHLPVVLNAIETQNATARAFERQRRSFDARLAALEEGRAEMEPRLRSLDESVQALGESLRTLDREVAYVQRRGEVIRREVMYDARYGRGVEAVEPPKLNISKLRVDGELRLNLGSGTVPREGFVNVDARELDSVDLIADVRELPFDPRTVAEIYSSHLVEHFPIEELRRVLLPHWLKVLEPGGRFSVVSPDAERMIEEAAAGRMPFDDLQRVIFCDQNNAADFHFAMFSPDSFARLLVDAGFAEVDIVDRGRRHGLYYDFEVRAERPPAEQDPLAERGGHGA